MKRPKVLVLGIGNILLGDEGVGVHVVDYLRGQNIPDEAELLDGGTLGADLIDQISDMQKVIVVDAMHTDYPPGTILRFNPQILKPVDVPQLSIHSLDLPQTLAMTELLGCPPGEVVIWGIQPQRVECTMELSPLIQAVIPKAAKLVLDEIQKHLSKINN